MTQTSPSPPPRLSTSEFWHEVVEGVFNLERGLPWTFWRMLVAPGRLIRAFVVDRDPRAVRPVRWFLTGFAVAALVFGLTGGDEATLEGMVEAGEASAGSARESAAWWVLSQVQWLLLVAVVPACAAALRVVFVREQPNFAEMWVFSLYVFGQSLLIGAIAMLVDLAVTLPELALPAIPAWFFTAASLGYFTGPWPGRVVRTVLALVLSSALVVLFLAGVFYAATGVIEALG